MTRVLFWVCTLIFAASGFLATGLFVTDVPSGAGMVMIFFLPLCLISVVSGLAACLIERLRGDALGRFEHRLGLGVCALLCIGVCALALALALE